MLGLVIPSRRTTSIYEDKLAMYLRRIGKIQRAQKTRFTESTPTTTTWETRRNCLRTATTTMTINEINDGRVNFLSIAYEPFLL